MILPLLLLQTAIHWRQLQPGAGTTPKASWLRDAQPRVSLAQVRGVPAVAVARTGPLSARIVVSTGEMCDIAFLQPAKPALATVALWRGRVAVAAGGHYGAAYERTDSLISLTGPCLAMDTPEGRYPTGIHTFIWLAAIAMPDMATPLYGLPINFTPYMYGLTGAGLSYVSGPRGETVKR